MCHLSLGVNEYVYLFIINPLGFLKNANKATLKKYYKEEATHVLMVMLAIIELLDGEAREALSYAMCRSADRPSPTSSRCLTDGMRSS